ncbi:PAS domain S-box protein [Methylocystis sp. MJC1]|jgi:PAS domain S-box-containing protein|uniref:PAS domain S-box protein n=1 Tax=Methylocystis sp. MJC1 TaxID=2654282 RepID=UPI0013EC20A6|nr:PAS domain S-box protein [Methylocystis sp. MJC1]KAF2991649.1 Blue-light-activated histidine kinase [Methylocystis sp. MJC1]MBU6527112.1 PAS domain S-box protein [Methylocystis sp. MJC1]UZX13548.1 PAS domain S-box protein [Methylocystis sp. MJC1]
MRDMESSNLHAVEDRFPFYARLPLRILADKAELPENSYYVLAPALGVALAVLAILARALLIGMATTKVAYITLFPLVPVGALVGGWITGTTVAVLGAILLHTFVLPLEGGADWFALLVFLGSCGLIIGTTELMHRAEARAFKAEAMEAVQSQILEERKRGADTLRVALSRLEATFENAAVGIAEVGLDGRWLRMNERLCDIVGYRRDELMQMKAGDITHAEDREADRENVRRLLAGEAGSYSTEKRYIRKDGKNVWANVTVGIARNATDQPVNFVAVVEDITARKAAEAHNQLLVAEISHRANNLLAVVQAIAQQTSFEGDPKAYVAKLVERIQSLAASQRLLVRNEWQGTDLCDLVRAQLAPYRDLIGGRIVANGPAIRVNAAAAQTIGMALHELATNAAKYGSLSNEDGKVQIAWGVAGDEFSISWEENGGPKVAPPTRKGFGKTVLGRMAEISVGGHAQLTFAENGARWTLTAPADRIFVR